jgi:hypothetical protein
MNPIAAAVDGHLWDGLRAQAGIEITYRRGTMETTLDAVKAGNLQTLTTPDGYTASVFDDDFLVRVDDLFLGGVRTLPRRHDKIEWEDDNCDKHEFDVGIDGFDRQFRYVGPYRSVLRVHTTEKKLQGS